MVKNLDKYKVAYILTPVEFGGSEQVSLNFLRHFQRDGFQIYPILLCRPWESDNIFINNLKDMGVNYSIIPTRMKPKDQGNDYFRLLRCGRAIYRELKNERFDLVHTNGYFADILGLLSAKLLKIPVISTCHGFISNDIKLSLYNRLDILSLGFMNQIITVSEKIKNDLIGKGIRHSKIQVIQNAVELRPDNTEIQRLREMTRSHFNIKEEEILIGYVGRLSKEKGIKYLIESGAGLYKAGIRFRMLIIGEGPQKQEIVDYVERYKLEKVVIFAGFQEKISDILPALDLFVLPSLTEGTSMALLEAMAFGLPVIATAVGGTTKVVSSEKNGMLVPSKSTEAIEQTVIKLMEDPFLMKQLGAAAIKTIESDYSIQNWIGKFDDLYSTIILQRNKH